MDRNPQLPARRQVRLKFKRLSEKKGSLFIILFG